MDLRLFLNCGLDAVTANIVQRGPLARTEQKQLLRLNFLLVIGGNLLLSSFFREHNAFSLTSRVSVSGVKLTTKRKYSRNKSYNATTLPPGKSCLALPLSRELFCIPGGALLSFFSR